MMTVGIKEQQPQPRSLAESAYKGYGAFWGYSAEWDEEYTRVQESFKAEINAVLNEAFRLLDEHAVEIDNRAHSAMSLDACRKSYLEYWQPEALKFLKSRV